MHGPIIIVMYVKLLKYWELTFSDIQMLLINNYPKSRPSSSLDGSIITSVGVDDVVGGMIVTVLSELQCRTIKAC